MRLVDQIKSDTRSTFVGDEVDLDLAHIDERFVYEMISGAVEAEGRSEVASSERAAVTGSFARGTRLFVSGGKIWFLLVEDGLRCTTKKVFWPSHIEYRFSGNRCRSGGDLIYEIYK